MNIYVIFRIILCYISDIMPGKLKVRILAANNLPVMDRASELTDAFVEVGMHILFQSFLILFNQFYLNSR